MDWGTYASNAVVSGDSNGLLNLMDNYDKVKEFFAINLDAFITAASLKHFGMATVVSIPTKNIIPKEIKEGSMIEKQNWLNNEVCVMLDKCVMDNVNELQDIQGDFATPKSQMHEYSCRFPSYTNPGPWTYQYLSTFTQV